jgi:hypothetical protein
VVGPDPQAGFRIVADQLIALELSERSAGRWLTTTAAALVIAALWCVGAAVIFAITTGETVAKVFAGIAVGVALAAVGLAVKGFMSGGPEDRASKRLWELAHEGSSKDYLEKAITDLSNREHRNARRAWWLRRSAGALLVVVALGATAGVVDAKDGDDPGGGGGGDNGETAEDDSSKHAGPSDEELARRFRPILLFDSGERWRPLDVEGFFAEGRHRGCLFKQQGECPVLTSAGDLANLGKDDVLRVNGQSSRSHPGRFTGPDPVCQSKPVLDCDKGPTSRFYYHVVRGKELVFIDYWWYLRYNDASPGGRWDHQSDWEGVVVAVDPSGPAPTFQWVGFAAHEGVWRYLRSALRCDGRSTIGSCGVPGGIVRDRVNVYVANGTHAAYPYPCRSNSTLPLCQQNKTKLPLVGIRFSVPETGFDGRREWGANDDVDALAPFPDAPWVTWAGRWDVGKAVESPGKQDRYEEPGRSDQGTCPKKLCPQELPAGYDGPCFKWFGPSTAAVACVPSEAGKSAEADTGSLTVARAHVEGEQLIVDATAPTAASAPGVAQVIGPYIGPNEVIVVEGQAPKAAELYVRTRDGKDVVEARFTDLGLERGGRAIARPATTSDGALTISVERPDGTEVSATRPVVLSGSD